MELRLDGDERSIVEKSAAYQPDGRLFIDINYTGVNITAVLWASTVTILAVGFLSGNIQPVFMLFVTASLLCVMTQVSSQFKALIILIKKQQEYIRSVSSEQSTPTLSDPAAALLAKIKAENGLK